MASSGRHAVFPIIFVLAVGFLACDVNAGMTTKPPEPEDAIVISLADLNSTGHNGQAFHTRAKLGRNGDTRIKITDIPAVVSFVIVQIHVPESNVTLSYDDLALYRRLNGSATGSNVGLDIYVNGSTSARVTVSNDNNATLDALVAVVAYGDDAPTPGGCNLEFDVETSPFQKLAVSEATITIDGQPASAPRVKGNIPNCEKYHVKLEAYRLYLPERDYTSETYFDGILKMMTVEGIIQHGQKIRPAVGASPVRRVYSAYPGTGSVYSMIATYGNSSAAYVPIASYACSPLTEPSSCKNLNTTISQAVCAMLLVVGLIVAFVGHKCLGFEVVFLGAISGGIISFCVLAAIGYFETSTVLGIVLGVSVLSGIGWLVLSLCMGMPCVVTFLASMTLGFFVSSTVYFGIADDTPLFESDVNFWLIYAGVTLLVPLVLAVLPFSSNVVCCAILGSYSIILPIDYYAGSNLKYIVINTVRRATVRGFNVAVIQPPYQGTDKCLVAFLIIVAMLGIYTQVCRLRCCCTGRNRTSVYWDDREPILSNPRGGRRVLVLGQNDRVERHSYH